MMQFKPTNSCKKRTSRTIRFGVKDANSGLCSETWKVWIGKNSKDVYVVCRATGRDVKLSLHESGRWHFAFQRSDTFADDTRPLTKFIGEHQRPKSSADRATLAVRIHIPWFAATLDPPKEDKEIIWLAPAAAGQSIEIAIFLFDFGARPPDDWPGKSSMGTQFVGALDFEDEGAVVFVQHTVPVAEIPEQPAKQTFLNGQTSANLQTSGLRMVAWGANADGSLLMMEMPIQTKRR